MPDNSAGPVFTGVQVLLELIRALYRRPRRFERDPRLDVRGDVPLPLVCLIREKGVNGFLAHLDRLLDEEIPQVPHVLADAAKASRRADSVLPLLDVLHDRLGADKFGKGRLKRFDNYELARWLTEQELPPPKTRRHRPVVDMIRDWVGRRPVARRTPPTGYPTTGPVSSSGWPFWQAG